MVKRSDLNTILIVGAVGVGAYFLYKAFSGGAGEVFTGTSDLIGGAGTLTGGVLSTIGAIETGIGTDLTTAGETLQVLQPTFTGISGIEPLRSVREIPKSYSTLTTYSKSEIIKPEIKAAMPLIGFGGVTGIGIDLFPTIVTGASAAYKWADKTIFGGILPSGYVKSSMSSYQAIASQPIQSTTQKTTTLPQPIKSKPLPQVSGGGSVSKPIFGPTFADLGYKPAFFMR